VIVVTVIADFLLGGNDVDTPFFAVVTRQVSQACMGMGITAAIGLHGNALVDETIAVVVAAITLLGAGLTGVADGAVFAARPHVAVPVLVAIGATNQLALTVNTGHLGKGGLTKVRAGKRRAVVGAAPTISGVAHHIVVLCLSAVAVVVRAVATIGAIAERRIRSRVGRAGRFAAIVRFVVEIGGTGETAVDDAPAVSAARDSPGQCTELSTPPTVAGIGLQSGVVSLCLLRTGRIGPEALRRGKKGRSAIWSSVFVVVAGEAEGIHLTA
jgi:hypothetical protein